MAGLKKRKIRMKLFNILLLFILFGSFAKSQGQDNGFLDAEQRRRSELMRQIDSGVYFMDHSEYELADTKFRFVLENIRSVPSDLTYYFGKNSFLLGKFRQSIDWLNKYIQLKGTSGQFSDEAASLMKKAEAEVVKLKPIESKNVQEVLSTSFDIDCGPTGKVSCPVCKGTHVIIKKGPFGDEYKTCGYCNEHGILTCEEYNLLIRGKLKPKS
jgi:hypothetical protein